MSAAPASLFCENYSHKTKRYENFKKKNQYSNILIEDENGLQIIRVSKKLIKAFAASSRMHRSAKATA
jgi:hypothetical protein